MSGSDVRSEDTISIDVTLDKQNKMTVEESEELKTHNELLIDNDTEKFF